MTTSTLAQCGIIEGILFRTAAGEELYRNVPKSVKTFDLDCGFAACSRCAGPLNVTMTAGPRPWKLTIEDESWKITWYRLDLRTADGRAYTEEAP